jgi:hypothetical protein
MVQSVIIIAENSFTSACTIIYLSEVCSTATGLALCSICTGTAVIETTLTCHSNIIRIVSYWTGT